MTPVGAGRGWLRAMEVSAVVCLAALILWVYVAKAAGADERAAIRSLDSQISQAQREIRVLRAEAAHLEQPARLEALVRAHLPMQPPVPEQQTPAQALPSLLPADEPAAATEVQP